MKLIKWHIISTLLILIVIILPLYGGINGELLISITNT